MIGRSIEMSPDEGSLTEPYFTRSARAKSSRTKASHLLEGELLEEKRSALAEPMGKATESFSPRAIRLKPREAPRCGPIALVCCLKA